MESLGGSGGNSAALPPKTCDVSPRQAARAQTHKAGTFVAPLACLVSPVASLNGGASGHQMPQGAARSLVADTDF